MMRGRTNHRKRCKKAKIDKNFWEEFKQRGFKIDTRNDGSFHEYIKHAQFTKKSTDTYEISSDGKVSFNIVSPKLFMKTVSQIEELVKYKLFK